MFRNVIIQYILTGYWFGENDADRAFYFKDMSQVELATVALILCAVSDLLDKDLPPLMLLLLDRSFAPLKSGPLGAGKTRNSRTRITSACTRSSSPASTSGRTIRIRT
jgi:hypothetical protein